MAVSGDSRKPLVITGALALAVLVGVAIHIARDHGGGSGPTTPSLTLEWLAEHPTSLRDYVPGDMADLTIPAGESVTLVCSDTALGVSEIQIGTDGSDIVTEFRQPPAPGSSSAAPSFLAGATGSQLLYVGQVWGAGEPEPFWAMTCSRITPEATPLREVRLKFVMDDSSGDLTQAMRDLRRQWMRGELTDIQHMRQVDAMVTGRWPELEWRALETLNR